MIVSGSVGVKCAVPSGSGEWSPGDVDIFCTWDAAPMVRRRLIQRCGLVCGGVLREESYTEGDPLVGDVENRATAVIHHVEEYAARPKNDETVKRVTRNWEYNGFKAEALKAEAYYEEAKRWGAEVLLKKTLDPDIGNPGGALGGDFLFDFHYEHKGFVQLIIGRPHVKDATKLLHHFDIEICKCAFSASKVYIPAAVETLAGRTFITPARHALADSFMKALNKVKPKITNGTCTYRSDMPKVLAKMKKQVWKGIGLPSYNGSQYDFEHKYKVIARLFERIQKYHGRGVKITNAPDGALDWEIPCLGSIYD